MNIAEQIFETVKTLPEPQAAQVLSFAESLKAKTDALNQARRESALGTLKKYRGRFKAQPFDRDECYDRPSLR